MAGFYFSAVEGVTVQDLLLTRRETFGGYDEAPALMQKRFLATSVFAFACLALSVSSLAAPNECKDILVRRCAADGVCVDQKLVLCDPDVRVIREDGALGAPYVPLLYSRGFLVPRTLRPDGSALFDVERQDGRKGTCTLPTRHNGLAAPLRAQGGWVQFDKAGRRQSTMIPVAVFGDSPRLGSITRLAIERLNDELSANRVALRIKFQDVFEMSTAVAVSATKLPSKTQAFTTEFSRVAGQFSAEALVQGISVDLAQGSDEDTLAHELLHAIGLNHEAAPGGSIIGRMSEWRPVDPRSGRRLSDALSPCEAGVLMAMYGYEGGGAVLK